MNGPQPDDEDQHKTFLLAALRAASARAKLMDADITTIGIALKGDLIGCETAVAWIRDSGLLGMVGAIPEQVGRAEARISVEMSDAAG